MRATLLSCAIGLLAAATPAAAQTADDINERGVILYKSGRFEEALTLLQDAHARSPKAHYMYNIGRCLQQLGRDDDAVATFAALLSREDLLRGRYTRYRQKARLALAELRSAIDARKPPGSPTILIPEASIVVDGIQIRVPSFEVEQTETSVGAYGFCVRAGKCKAPDFNDSDPTLPVRGVSWHDADAFCAFLGRRLPTELEWELAAGGSEGSQWPWGNEADCTASNLRCEGSSRPIPVGSHKRDRTAAGVADLAGNVAEWVADWYSDVRASSPAGPTSGSRRTIRGGSWETTLLQATSRSRYGLSPQRTRGDVGFRCARNAP